jgi:integrase
MARRKSYQKGTVFKRGKKGNMVWVGRWWENGINKDGSPRRVRRSKVLGTAAEVKSQREAQLSLDKCLNAHNSGRQRAESKMKFREFIESRWLRDVLPSFKLFTRLQYFYFVQKYLLPYFGAWPLEDIRPEEVQRFVNFFSELAPKTVRSMAAALSSSLRTAVRRGFLETNPVRGVALPPKRSIRERRALSQEEVAVLLAELKEPCRAIVILIVLTGMRIGEVLALRWGKIDWQEKILLVDEGVYEKEVSTPKTESGIRTLPLSDFLMSQLETWGGGRMHNQEDLIFPNEVGRIHSRRNLANRQLAPAARAAGLPRIGWHMLRRTRSTWLKNAPGVIQNQLGHSDPRLAFQLYVVSVPGERRAAVERLSVRFERLLDPNSTQGDSGFEPSAVRNA